MSGTPRPGSGAAISSRRLGWVALALALLLPARAAALCCIETTAERTPAAIAHEGAHHSTAAADPASAALSPETGDPDCGSLEEAAPALRERGPDDEGSSVLPASLAPITAATGARSAHASARSPMTEFPHRPITPIRI